MGRGVRVLILRVAGTNCDLETKFAFELSGAEVDLLHINRVKEKKESIFSYKIICLPGGFSYGDDVAAGKIFSLEIKNWFKNEIQRFIDKGGLLLGICNGFQVLVKAGILPDKDFIQKVSLILNDSGKFEDRWVYLKIEKNQEIRENVWFKELPEIITLPVAHAEGKFYAEEKLLERLERKGQLVLRYVDSRGASGGYPYNPNGSVKNVAGIVDDTGRILGLMPHPERHIFKTQSPWWKIREEPGWGFKIFKNAVDYFS